MCSFEVQNVIGETVDEFVVQGRTFTAYDVTMGAREKTDEEFFHGEVRQLIHSLMDKHIQAGNYQRGQSTQYGAFEYTPVQAHIVPARPGVAPKVGVSVFDPTVSAAPKTTKCVNGLKTDKRGTLAIRTSVVKGVNWQSGDTVFANVFHDHVVVSKDSLPNAHPSRKYTVDKYGNVRITSSVLGKAGLSGPKFNVKAFKNSVEIR